jgi:hypothetical protein
MKQHKQFGTVTELKDNEAKVRWTHDIWGKHEQRLDTFTLDELLKFNDKQFEDKPTRAKRGQRKVTASFNHPSSREIGNVLDLLG